MYGSIKKNNAGFSSYDMLFGDLPLSYWASVNSGEQPWRLFKLVKKSIEKEDKQYAIDILKEIIEMPGLESRHYLQAYHFLNDLGITHEGDTKVFGVVLEVNMPQGNDTLAVYTDHSARYYNYSGNSIIWEHADDSLDAVIDGIMEGSKKVVMQIGPWKDKRPAPPTNQMVRINFLTSNGLHFGEATQQVLFNAPFAGKLMYKMLNLMNTLIDKVIPANEISAVS